MPGNISVPTTSIAPQGTSHILGPWQLGTSLQAVNVGGNFNITNEGLHRLITRHPNRHKSVMHYAITGGAPIVTS